MANQATTSSRRRTTAPIPQGPTSDLRQFFANMIEEMPGNAQTRGARLRSANRLMTKLDQQIESWQQQAGAASQQMPSMGAGGAAGSSFGTAAGATGVAPEAEYAEGYQGQEEGSAAQGPQQWAGAAGNPGAMPQPPAAEASPIQAEAMAANTTLQAAGETGAQPRRRRASSAQT
jgi:hypothetical protein